jgi:hypothetical protein
MNGPERSVSHRLADLEEKLDKVAEETVTRLAKIEAYLTSPGATAHNQRILHNR